MTTDTAALQERIEHALWGVTQAYDAEDGRGTEVGVHAPTHKVVAAVLPVIAAEVQAAKIKAWQEGVNFALPNAETTWYPQHNPYRTTEHETGDQA